MDFDLTEVNAILNKYKMQRESLISILQDIQATHNYLPQESLRYVAEKLVVPLIDVYSVATFYKSFSLTPRGRHLVTVCLGTACHVRGGPRVVDGFQRRLQIRPGETTEDNEVTLETVNCLGACALGPVVVIDGEYHGQMTKAKVDSLISELKNSKRAKENG